MPLSKSKTQDAFKSNVSEMVRAGHPLNQALAAAYRVQRGKANGGGVSLPNILGRMERGTLSQSGFMNGLTTGRGDHVPVSVKSNSYVIPADIVSGIGQGNSLSGAHALNRAFKMGPYGMARRGKARFAGGGEVEAPTDIAISDGEFTIPPDKVAEIGNGDINRGHQILDALVKHIRQKTIKTLRKLPEPKKS